MGLRRAGVLLSQVTKLIAPLRGLGQSVRAIRASHVSWAFTSSC